MTLLRLVSLMYLFLYTFAHTNDQYLVCKPVGSVFDGNDDNPNETTTSRRDCNVAGHPGKRGARGSQGSPGQVGPPGVVDYDLVNVQLRRELQDIIRQLKCKDGVVVGDICYRLAYRVGVGVNYDQARDLCIFHGGLLAEIPNEEVYNAVFNYVKSSWYINVDNQDLDYAQLWIDGVYQNGEIVLRNRQPGYTSWFPSYPSSTAGHNRILWIVHIKPSRTKANTGMFNYNPTHPDIPLCQFALSDV